MFKKLILTYGRFNPPHNGHLILFDYIERLSNKLNCDSEIWLSHTHDKKSNWLNQERKLYYLKLISPNNNFLCSDKTLHSIIPILKLKAETYDEIILVLGSDRIDVFKQLLNDYNGKEYNFRKISVISCNDRNDRNVYSSTLVRKSVKENDRLTFDYLLSNIEKKIRTELFIELRGFI